MELSAGFLDYVVRTLEEHLTKPVLASWVTAELETVRECAVKICRATSHDAEWSQTIFCVADMLTSIRVMVESSAAASVVPCRLLAGRHGGDLDLVVETSMLTTAWDASQKSQTGALRFHQELNCSVKVLQRVWAMLAPPPDSGLDTFLVSATGLYRAMSVYAFACQ